MPKYCLDIVQQKYLGGLRPFLYSINTLYVLISTLLIIVFNFSNHSKYTWLNILTVLAEYPRTAKQISLTENDFHSLMVKVKFCLKLIPRLTILIMSLMFLFSSYLMFNVHRELDFLLYGIPTIVLFLSYGYSAADILLYTCLCSFVVIEFYRKSLLNINKIAIGLNHRSKDNNGWSSLIKQYSQVIKEIDQCNSFWKTVNLVLFHTIYLLNLLLIHQIFFGKYLSLIFMILFVTVFILTFVLNLYVCFKIASINSIANKSHKILLKIKTDIKLNERKAAIKVIYILMIHHALEITTVIDLSLLFDADKDRNEDIESAENAIT